MREVQLLGHHGGPDLCPGGDLRHWLSLRQLPGRQWRRPPGSQAGPQHSPRPRQLRGDGVRGGGGGQARGLHQHLLPPRLDQRRHADPRYRGATSRLVGLVRLEPLLRLLWSRGSENEDEAVWRPVSVSGLTAPPGASRGA